MIKKSKIQLLIDFIVIIILLLLIAATAPAAQETKEITPAPTLTIQEQETIEYNDIIQDNEAKAFIYYNESGFAPNNIYLPVKETNKKSGKKGICQLHTEDGKDLNQQDKDCTNYMEHRYGTWEAAQQFWVENGWW